MPVAIIGAGPYGLATAAYLRQAGVETHVFGEAMESWRRNMPAGMLLRSHRHASNIASPGAELSIDRWAGEAGSEPPEPMPVEDFISYGLWYGERAVPELDPRRVRGLFPVRGGFSLQLEDGDELLAKRVVVAAGIVPCAHWPELFRDLPRGLVSHASQHSNLREFGGRTVLVLGAGQSALETAALLKEAGAKPRVIARATGFGWLPPHNPPGFRAALRRTVLPPTGVGGRVTGWLAAIPGGLARCPAGLRSWVDERCMRPVGAEWLRSRLEGVPLEADRVVEEARPDGEGLRIKLSDGTELAVDHLILGTGYRVDLDRYGFLGDEVLARVERVNGSPRLGAGLESSLPGLHFAGAAAAASFGPITRFVVGTWYAAPAIATAISGLRQRPAHLAYMPRVGFASRGSERGHDVGDPLGGAPVP
ncbi:MAG TPA: FAD-dependent oxidoreductase [Solirubrobacterales bacterium]|nr:FAD-dependent oxidoreductase [Solirubrobacterales bacterium]